MSFLPRSRPLRRYNGFRLTFNLQRSPFRSVHLIFASSGTRRARPSISARRFRNQWRLHASHMEMIFAAGAIDRFRPRYGKVLVSKLEYFHKRQFWVKNSRWTPFTAGLAKTKAIHQVWDDVLLRNNILISRYQYIFDMPRDWKKISNLMQQRVTCYSRLWTSVMGRTSNSFLMKGSNSF